MYDNGRHTNKPLFKTKTKLGDQTQRKTLNWDMHKRQWKQTT